MTLEEYSTLIQKEFFYLFEQYDFRIVYTKEFRAGYFSVGLESNLCRILFAREQGGGIMYLGTLDAPFEYEDNPKWTIMLNLLTYVLKKEWDWSFLEGKSYNERIISWVSFNAKEFKSVCRQVLEMFSSPEMVAQWMPAYQEYENERIRQQHVSK